MGHRAGNVLEVTLDDDVVEAVEQLQRELGLDLDDALNLLVRRGMARSEADWSPPGSLPHRVLSVDDGEPPFRPRG